VTDHRRALPSVSALLECAALRPLAVSTARARVTDAVRASMARVRDGSLNMPPDLEGWAASVACDISASERLSLRAAINATGVVLHTNLGRAPLAQAALDAVAATAAGFSTLEYDASTGTRGSRYTHCAALLRELTGAEDALVVNNGAAALVLALDTVAAGREAIISRGELVEIGGSFRIHEIVERSGVTLREVGASNRTHLADYVRAIGPATGALLKVHRSNFAVSGFVADVAVRELRPVARRRWRSIGIPTAPGVRSPCSRCCLRRWRCFVHAPRRSAWHSTTPASRATS
jgi:L-seryl-tRNA(Ser) seleniumtransferase